MARMMICISHSFRHSFLHRFRLQILALALLLVASSYYIKPAHITSPSTSAFPTIFTPVTLNTTKPVRDVRVAKATILYGQKNFVYEKALDSHAQHNKLHGYEMHILRHQITKDIWGKWLWLQSLVTNELRKSAEDRVDWIMYFEPSVVLLNSRVPLRVFLPPTEDIFDDVTLILAKPDGKAISTSTFFIRVSESSLQILTRALSSFLQPVLSESGVDPSDSILQVILKEHPYQEKALYQPAHWYNSVVTNNGFISEDDLLVRFPIDLQGKRWKLMDDLLTSLPFNHLRFSKPIEDTRYATEPQRFWESVMEAKQVLEKAEENMGGDGQEELSRRAQKLKDRIEQYAWDGESLSVAVAAVEILLRGQ
ncbi:uncharacterized protein BDR25DRAFT_288241 [Lindgomyces ingoldianus]|uniref:Uncharacterized protein n=1 Tax=Lindgomyces ingoldianus TaxID=673940 RepID=A0ACB6QS49_9PLEO|nr:uncharacterized protein BDR25DRAFT_288241 [Lindgomyces ingoldianus]KAF2469813.1 hypothetical protein BDR25DRAFT_288241 [Lindgomyces ingoldianus]